MTDRNAEIDELRLSVAKSVARILEAEARTVESYQDQPGYGAIDPRDYGIGDTFPFFAQNPSAAPAWLDRRKKGEFVPAYLNEAQLSWVRRRVRHLVLNNEIAIAILSAHVSYCVGDGLKYSANAKHDGAPESLVCDVQALLDVFREYNELGRRETEALVRLATDGEAFLRFFPAPDGMLAVRFIEPELVKSPHGESDNAETSFGVQTRKYDVETVEGYWVVEGLPDEDPTPTFVPASDVLHLKWWETPSSAKRGWSPFYPIEVNLRAAEDLLTSTVSLAKARAKIAMVRKLSGTVGDIASALVTSQSSQVVTDPSNGGTVNLEKYRNASILTIPESSTLEFPGAQIQASDHVAVYQMVLRTIGARFSMPEYLVSGDASNANYASTMVAESPFVKAMDRLQGQMKRAFGEHRYGDSTRSAAWRMVRHAVNLGLLPPEVYRLIDIQVEAPMLTVRDPQKDSQVNNTYHQMGVKSKKTIQLEIGLDPDQEEENFKGEQAQQPGQPGGQPGQDPDQTPPPASPDGGDEGDEAGGDDGDLSFGESCRMTEAVDKPCGPSESNSNVYVKVVNGQTSPCKKSEANAVAKGARAGLGPALQTPSPGADAPRERVKRPRAKKQKTDPEPTNPNAPPDKGTARQKHGERVLHEMLGKNYHNVSTKRVRLVPDTNLVSAPFDCVSEDGSELIDAKTAMEDRLEVKPEKAFNCFFAWALGGHKALASNLVLTPTGWYVVPGIPPKGVNLDPNVKEFDPKHPVRPIFLCADGDKEARLKRFKKIYAKLKKHKELIVAETRKDYENNIADLAKTIPKDPVALKIFEEHLGIDKLKADVATAKQVNNLLLKLLRASGDEKAAIEKELTGLDPNWNNESP